ncbi:MAG: glycosyl hydrolase family 28-related protein, partial [Victivallaceae bacterium]
EAVELEFVGDGMLELAEGVTLTVNGPLRAGERRIFCGSGRVEGAVKAACILPQWFGATGDGRTDDSGALQRAADLARSSTARKLVIPQGVYRIENSVKFRCNIDNYGVLRRPIEPDEAKRSDFSNTYMASYPVKKNVLISIVPDQEPVELDPSAFGEIRAGEFKLERFADIPLAADPAKKITLEPGGTLIVSGTDFFTARMNMKGDEFYTPNDVAMVVSPRGDVFPEFCFNYRAADGKGVAWDTQKQYRRGDYVTVAGELYKASFPSGPGASYRHPFKGKAEIGPSSPASGERKKLIYPDKSEDSIRLWVKVTRSIRYVPPQAPLTINNLRIEGFMENSSPGFKPVLAALAANTRSSVTYNRLQVAGIDRQMMLSTLFSVTNCAAVTFNDGAFSGATFQGLGYNILHNNAAHIVYNNCVSINARKGMAGRHGKNITVNGGFYNVIDDHYGMNYTIRDAELNALSVGIPGYCTPKIELEKWFFEPSHALVFAGGNITVENCRIRNAESIFLNRVDVGDLFGTITLRDISVEAPRDFTILSYRTLADFDYAHSVRTPARLVIDNVIATGSGRGRLRIDNFTGTVVPVRINNCDPVGEVLINGGDLRISDCRLLNAAFKVGAGSRLYFRDNLFDGAVSGLDAAAVGGNSGNTFSNGATLPK